MELSKSLGANAGTSVQCLTLYIPSCDLAGVELGNQRKWVIECAQLLAKIGGGVTIMPPVEGGWVNDQGKIIWEKPVLVYAFIKPESFLELLGELREILHRMGRETNQGEVVFEFDGRLYRIRKFDAASGK